MIHKFPKGEKQKIKNNKQAEEVHKKVTKTYTEEEVLAILNLIQNSGGTENGK
ncbi:hypothetical protein EDD74_1194 [Faecalimonas umbilicata]|uniref:Uncharacterized protein n=1 Tax=Faecalimonas umbilicata TaxID=1912855 RepID=A0A4R3JKM2_9FIRM|nr:hypothetical protein [Faecalimonas umbilicata]TCS66106.1 hypothetical protein EDD74_1194 [Faecalimonas umbilicata]GBU06577.1 hypothetical protein FAEUMB_31180 [Faecalimonas umbilicata]